MDYYERLLAAMPYIAEEVNRFHSPEVQRMAFDALLLACLDAPPAAPAPERPETIALAEPDRLPPRPLGTMATPPEAGDTEDRYPAARPLGTMAIPLVNGLSG